MVQKYDQNVMREKNTSIVLQELFNAQQTSRIKIAQNLQLHKSTISSIYNDLDAMNFIEKIGQGEADRLGGRKPEIIRFNKNLGYVVGIDIGRHHLRWTATNLKGNMLLRDRQLIKSPKAKDIAEQIIQVIGKLEKFKTKKGLLGITISLPGVVRGEQIIYSPFFEELVGFDLVSAVSKKIKIPVLIENEANMAAVYTRDYHDYQYDLHFDNIQVVNIHNGIGVGEIMFNRLQRGPDGSAGEIGQTVINFDGKSERLEDLFSEDALIRRFGKIKRKNEMVREDLLTAYKEGDKKANELISEWIEVIGTQLYNLSLVNNPQALFVHSRILAELPGSFEKIVDKYNGLRKLAGPPVFFAGKSSEVATQLGGAALMIRSLLGLIKENLIFEEELQLKNTQ